MNDDGRVMTTSKQTDYAEPIIPVDFQTAGHIRDDEIYKNLLCSLPAGVHVTVVVDTCHSAVKLPYELNALSSSVNPAMVGMADVFTFAFKVIIALAVGGAVLGVASGLTGNEVNNVARDCCDSFYWPLCLIKICLPAKVFQFALIKPHEKNEKNEYPKYFDNQGSISLFDGIQGLNLFLSRNDISHGCFDVIF